jgi:hypothetical protein
VSVAIRTATRIQDQDDFGSVPGAGNDGYALTWDNGTGEFVLAAVSAGVTDHGALTGLTDDDHTGYLLATGARTGASSQGQTFTNGIIGPAWKPASDSTTALQMQQAGGTAILTVDTTNRRIGVNTTPSAARLEFQALGTNEALLVFRDSGGNSRLIMFDSGNVFSSAVPSTSGDTTKSSGAFIFNRTRWNGSASVEEGFAFSHLAYDSSAGRSALWLQNSASGVVMALSNGTYGQVAINYAYPADALISLGQLILRPYDASTVGMTIWLQNAQSANAYQAADKDGTPIWAIGPTGQQKTNQATANTNTPSGATAYQLPIYNASGSLLGYVPIYGSAW